MVDLTKIGVGTYRLLGESCVNVVENAINAGYKVIDTALLYRNHNDVLLGVIRSSQPRENLFIISKIHFKNIRRGTVLDGLFRIMKELETQYIDLLLLHGPIDKDKNIQAWRVLEQAVKDGYVRYIGVSNYRISELDELLAVCTIKPYINQIEISPFNTRANLVKYCREKDILIQAYGSLTKGYKLNNEVVQRIAKKYNITSAQVLLRWGYQKGYYLVLGSSSINHLQENLRIVDKDFPSISEIDIDMLDKLNENFYTIENYKD